MWTVSQEISQKEKIMLEERETASPENKRSALREALPQILAVCVKNVLLLGFGMTLGFPTILIPSLSGNDPQEKISLGEEAISWIGSLNLICVPVGCLMSGAITQPIGRKKAMQLVNIPFLTAWLLFHFSTEAWQIFLALCLTGLTGGLLEAPTLTYVAEITTPELRGILASTSTIAVISGILTQFLLGTFLHWRTVAVVSCVMPVTSYILLFFVPESPHWLISKNRLEDAQKSIAWLRGWVDIKMIEVEFKHLCDHIHIKEKIPKKCLNLENIKLYTKKNFLWPFSIVSFAFLLGHFSGMTTLQTYAVKIFATLKAPIDKYYATIFLGISEVSGCILSACLVHYVGKRKMNFFSLIGSGCCFTVVATYAYLINVNNLQTAVNRSANVTLTEISSTTETHNWIPMTFLILAAFCTHTGIRILPWMLVGEVYSHETRATASGFSGAVSYIFGFISNKIFFVMISFLTLPGTFWFYSCISFIGFIVLYLVLPETEGKTLFEITQHFTGVTELNNKVFKKRPHLTGQINSGYINGDKKNEHEESKL